jgi:hypothetical protein
MLLLLFNQPTGGTTFNKAVAARLAAATTPLTVSNAWTVSGSGNPDLALWAYR